MKIALEIADPLINPLMAIGESLSRSVLEGFAADAYRSGTLSRSGVGRLLGHHSVWETEAFLSRHDAWPSPTRDEVLSDLAHLRSADKERFNNDLHTTHSGSLVGWMPAGRSTNAA